MKFCIRFFFVSILLFLNLPANSNENKLATISDYNARLPYWGTVWNPGKNSVSRYYPSFYTGFASRSQFPDRIHIRTSRGNQTRVTVILDDQTLVDYLFDLEKRYRTYQVLTAEGILRLASEENALAQLQYFNQIMESSEYDILPFVQRANAGLESREDIYAKALSTIERLNPGRVFRLNIDLNKEFKNWGKILTTLRGDRPESSAFTVNSTETVIALNTLVFGRINFVGKPTSEILAALQEASTLANDDVSSQEFTASALRMLRLVTGDKYGFKSPNSVGFLQDSIQCEDLSRCVLSYPEFTAIYPTGSAEAFTSDKYGNRIQAFATPGLWQFLAYNSSGRDFDNIRKEPYYGFIPKMDFEGIGNGFHNPAVTFWSVGKDVRTALSIPTQFNAFGAVKRGGVSSGCLRLPAGHLWELRHIFPVENSVATKVFFFGNDSKDFDLFDINGDGYPEVMGVEYMISYSVAGADGLAKRDGGALDLKNKLDFYRNLYGQNQVFEVLNEKIQFRNPSVSFPSHLDWKKKSVSTSYVIPGAYGLYEQTYERDKIQFYSPVLTSGLTEMSQAPVSKRIVRLMGRVRGCSPSSEKKSCGSAAFEIEAKAIFKELNLEIALP